MEESRTFDTNDLNWIANSLRVNSIMMTYTGDLSDCGNEIGIIVGEKYKNMTEDETRDFISGIKHGISLTNGTH
jgi:2-keto-4-pentenoate hydratase/2-oxohepta-3-ene-1,7-dioic acid hydratase in catechol pathway